MPTSDIDFLNLLTDIIQKQIVILGRDVVLRKARSIGKITIDDTGAVTAVEGEAKVYLKSLIVSLAEISPESIRKTIEPMVSGNPELQALISHLQVEGKEDAAPTAQVPVVSPTSK